MKAWEENCSNKREQKLQKTAAIDMEAAEEWKSKINILQKISLMQMKQDCFIDRCPEKFLFRKGEDVKVGNLP
jgi:hypothetical protein